MKKIIMIMLVAAISIFSIFLAKGEVSAVTWPKSEEFVIGLESNPSTGYEWYPSYSETRFNLVEQWFVQEDAPPGSYGVGGITYFKFKALSSRSSTIVFEYKRYWEGEVIDRKYFKVRIL